MRRRVAHRLRGQPFSGGLRRHHPPGIAAYLAWVAWVTWVAAAGLAGCDRPNSTAPANGDVAAAVSRTTSQTGSQTTAALRKKVVKPGFQRISGGADAVVGTIDGAPILLSSVRARLNQAETTLSDGEAKATALLAAAADVVCLREFAVLDLTPKANEAAHVAVDRLLAGTWPADDRCHADPSALKMAFLGHPGRWRHPTALTLWEAQISCCTDCTNVELDRCQRTTEAAVAAFATTLRGAVPAPLAAAQATLANSPARARHIPAFERTVAASAMTPRPKLLRYTAFARERAFRKMAFRRTDPTLERAALPLPIGGLTAPVRTAVGWSIAMVVGHEPPLQGGLRAAITQRGLRAEVCKRQASAQRAAYRDRMVANALLVWRRPIIRATLGADADAALPQPRRRVVPTLPSL